MAQVMNYWQWPTTETPEIPAYEYTVSNLQKDVKETFSADALPPVIFDWNNMRNRYLNEYGNPLSDVTDAQADAVATLMRYCGQSVHMVYSPYISIVNSHNIADALRQYFGYANSTMFVARDGYTIGEWEDMIYNELANNRPVIYSGASDEGGHAFICDGYDGNGLFHINWGWETNQDNYFSLSVLDPNVTNTTGATKPGIGFCMYQDAIIGIQPDNSGSAATTIYPELRSVNHYFAIEGKDKSGNLGYYLYVTCQFNSAIYSEAEFDIGLFYKENGTWKRDTYSSETLKLKTDEYNYYTFFYDKTVDPSEFPNGTKYLYPFYLCTSVEGAQWQPLAADNYYFVHTVEDGNVTITTMPSASALKVTKCAITCGTGAASEKSNLTLTIENTGDTDFEGNLILLPIYIGNDDPAAAEAVIKQMKDDEELPNGWTKEEAIISAVYLMAGKTGEITYVFTPKNAGKYLLLYETPGHEAIDPPYFTYTSITISPATGISETTTKTATTDGVFYDLQGHRLGSERPKQKGLYIKDNRKILIKNND